MTARAHPNIVFITIDAWRADFADDFAGVPLVPCLDAWRDRMVRWTRFHASAPWTTPSLISMFTGLAPARHGVHCEWDHVRPGTPTLATELAAAGYTVPNLVYLTDITNYHHLGWDPADAPARVSDPADPALVGAVVDLPEPFFAYFHYKYVHLPYNAWAAWGAAFDLPDPPAHLARSVGDRFVLPLGEQAFGPADKPFVEAMYAAGVLRMNAWLEAVLDAIRRSGRADNTVVVLTSDHGEELLDHGHVGHASTLHRAKLTEPLLHIPLMILDPRVDGPRDVHDRAWSPDLAPTIASLAGLRPWDCDGLDLSASVLDPGGDPTRPPEERIFVYSAARRGWLTPRDEANNRVTAWSDGRRKLVETSWQRPRWQLFDLVDDPAEQRPITQLGER